METYGKILLRRGTGILKKKKQEEILSVWMTGKDGMINMQDIKEKEYDFIFP